jgi:amidase
MHDPVNAFVNDLTLPGAPEGPLAGLTLGVKDLYDIEGHVTGCGSPDWLRSHGPATATAPAVQALLDAGAHMVGKTHTDELAFSLLGMNAHYGTPTNPAAPDRVPGGSSSGSAAAVAAGLVDIALGSDTGGSVRAPSSFCGIWGIRPTHGRVPLDHVMPLASSFDSAGWFTRDPELLARVGKVYGFNDDGPKPGKLLIPVDLWASVPSETVFALQSALKTVQERFGFVQLCRLTDLPLQEWFITFRVCQAADAWVAHGDWIEAEKPAFGPGIRDRFAFAKSVTPDQVSERRAMRKELVASLHDLLGDDGVLLLPTVPGAAPLLESSEDTLNVFRDQAMKLLCPAGLAGLPQLSMPLATVEGAPLGLSIVGPRNGEGTLFAMAREIAD